MSRHLAKVLETKMKFPRLLDRYILAEIKKPLIFSFFIFASLWIINLLIRVLNLAISKGIGWEALFKLVIYYLPTVIVTSAPMAVLMGCMLGITRLNNDSEIIALKAAGLSPLRLIYPLLLVGLAVSMVIFFLNEKIVPVAKFLSQQTYINEITLKKPLPKVAKNMFFDGGSKFKLYVRDYDQNTNSMLDVSMFQFNKDSYPSLTQASHANIQNGNLWVFKDGKTIYFDNDGSVKYQVRFATWSYPISDRYANHVVRNPENKSPSEMNMAELSETITRRDRRGLSTREFETQMYFRSAFPFASFFMVLVGVPLAMKHTRGGKSNGFGISILIMIIYYILLSTGKSLGGNGTVNPFISNWIPNCACLLLGLWFLRRSRT